MNTKISDAVAWTVVGPDGETSIGGWLGMHTYETSLKWATLREGHSYAFAYPQPAALNEVSGNSGELGGDERARLEAWLETISVDTTRWGDGNYTDPIAHNYWLAWQAALAATGKQQVGEVQGSREQFEVWARSQGWEDDDLAKYGLGRCVTSGEYHNSHLQGAWNGWQAAIASRQPERIDLSEFRDAVKQAISNVSYMTGEGAAYLKLTELLALIEIRARIDKIDGRDAGAEVGDGK